MRLTLRSLLAFMDDPGMDQDIRTELSRAFETDAHFSSVADRIQRLSSKPRLAAPKPDAQGRDDANRIAQYLDVSLPAELLGRFEQTCQKNDTLLAEVASCHQIVCQMQPHEPDVSPKLRDRLYQIPFEQTAGTPNIRSTVSKVPSAPSPEIKIHRAETTQPVTETPLAVQQSFSEYEETEYSQAVDSRDEKVTKTSATAGGEEESALNGRWLIVLAIVLLWVSVWVMFPKVRQEVWQGGQTAIQENSGETESGSTAAGSKLFGGTSQPIEQNPSQQGSTFTAKSDSAGLGSSPVEQKATDLASTIPSLEKSSELPGSLPTETPKNSSSIQKAEQKGLFPSLADSKASQSTSLPATQLPSTNPFSTEEPKQPKAGEQKSELPAGLPIVKNQEVPENPFPTNSQLDASGITSPLHQTNLPNDQKPGTGASSTQAKTDSVNPGVMTAGFQQNPKPGAAVQPASATAVSPKAPNPTVARFPRINWTENSAVVSGDADGKRMSKVLPLGKSRVTVQGQRSGAWIVTFTGGSRYEVRKKDGFKEIQPESALALRHGKILLQTNVQGETLRINTPIGPISITNRSPESELILEVKPVSPVGANAQSTACRYAVGCFGLKGKVVLHNGLMAEKFVAQNDWVLVQSDRTVNTMSEKPAPKILALAQWLRSGAVDPSVKVMAEVLDGPDAVASLQRIVKGPSPDEPTRRRKSLAASWLYEMDQFDSVFDVLGDLTMAQHWESHIQRVAVRLQTEPKAVGEFRQAMIRKRVPLWIEKTFYGYQPEKMDKQDWADLISALYNAEHPEVRVLAHRTLVRTTKKNFGYEPRLGIPGNHDAIVKWREWFTKGEFTKVQPIVEKPQVPNKLEAGQ